MLFGPNNRFRAEILVDNRPAEEFSHDGVTWVESVFDAKSTFREEVVETDPFGEPFKQTWPFTPFQVQVSLQNDAPSKYYWAEVFVDGVRAQHRILKGPAGREIFVGFTRRMGFGGGERAFCFSMPRPVFEVNGSSSAAPEDPEKLVEIGSVRIDIHETSLRKTVTEAVKSPGLGVAEGQDIDFTPTDKKTAKSVGITCAVRAGHVVGERKKLAEAKFETISGPKFETISTYDAPSQSNKIASCRIRYATRDKLEVMGLISSASRSSSFTSKCPPNLLPDKYSAAHMEDCLKFYFGMQMTPDIRNALRECEEVFLPLQPALRLPKSDLPHIFSEWGSGKAYLDKQVPASAEPGNFAFFEIFLPRDGKSDVQSRSMLVAQKVGGDATSSLSRAVSHQVFGSEQLFTVVQKMLPGSVSEAGCDSTDLYDLARTLQTNIMIWPASQQQDPILVKPPQSKFGTKCYNLGLANGSFALKRGRYWSLVDKDDADKEAEAKLANKRRRKGGA